MGSRPFRGRLAVGGRGPRHRVRQPGSAVRRRRSDGPANRGPWTASDGRPRRPLTHRSVHQFRHGVPHRVLGGPGSDRLVGRRSSVADRAPGMGRVRGRGSASGCAPHPTARTRASGGGVVDSDVRRRCVGGSGPTGQPRPRPWLDHTGNCALVGGAGARSGDSAGAPASDTRGIAVPAPTAQQAPRQTRADPSAGKRCRVR